MKTNLRTFTLCVKIQGCQKPGSYFQIFVGIYWTGLETRRQIAKKEMSQELRCFILICCYQVRAGPATTETKTDWSCMF